MLNSPYAALFFPNGHAHGFLPIAFSGGAAAAAEMTLPPDALSFLFYSYDFKNKLEESGSQNPSPLKFPERFFFKSEIQYGARELERFMKQPVSFALKTSIRPTVSRKDYIEKVRALKQHIQKGDIYEINYCITFEATDVSVRPASLYRQLNAISNAPYSAFIKLNELYIISSSPELFLRRRGNTLITKPIKGTAARGKNTEADAQARHELQASLKERTENVMIVDVARNDLSRIAARGSVHVEKLYDIESYA
ncbi:MAG: chorismate-binding protein, partial [Bacteroidia bacterium]